MTALVRRAALSVGLALALPDQALAQAIGSLPIAGPPADDSSVAVAKPRDAWQLQTIAIPEAPVHIRSAGAVANLDTVAIETRSGTLYALVDCVDGLCAEPIVNPRPLDPLPVGAVPGSQVGTGHHAIARAWLAEPAQRLEATTLGGPVAGALIVEDITARSYRMDLPTSEAFEDRRPRLVDLGPDHPDTILVVRSSVASGATLAAVELTGEGLLKTLAETEPLGAPGAWLNPIGAADVTGSGQIDIALVQSPDGDGRLQLLTYAGGTFHQRTSLRNVSNHVPGSDIIDMAVIADFDGDGIADIAVPDGERRHIRILTFRNGQVAEPANIALAAPVVTEIVAMEPGAGKRPLLLMGLADGQLVLLH